MKKKTVISALMLVAVANMGYTTYGKYKAMYSASALMLENIEALSQTEATKCPDPYDVPDRFIMKSSTQKETVTCSTSGSITIGKNTVIGSYERGKTYTVLVTHYDCIGEKTGACCKQSDVRCEVTRL